jgi:hypothetical protein
VVKLQKDLPLPDDSQSEGLFFQTEIIPRIQLQEAAARIKIRNLFTSLTFSEINDLVNRAKSLDSSYEPPNFSAYYVIDCPIEINATIFLENLLAHENVELAYIVNDSMPPQVVNGDPRVLDTLQGYLGPAPRGVDAEYAWKSKGGNGERTVKFIDIEQGWILDHESIRVDILPCTGLNYAFHDHGAGVLGIIMMKKNKNGGSGITPEAKGYVVSQWRPAGYLNNADAIMAALDHARYGDIILLQAQVRGLSPSKKLWPIEIHDANFDVIRLATALGVIVIEAAANGSLYFNLSSDLDQFILNGKTILNRSDADFKDSGAIMVAGATASVPHTRIYNSNYGSRIDCYAWGEGVYTAGNSPKSSNGAIDFYTREFCGTSSAAAIIAGVAISAQSIMEANYNLRLSPAEMREILSSELYGTPSANGRSIDKIGVMPDLKKIIDKALVDIVGESTGNDE